jgi:hypothetical protein
MAPPLELPESSEENGVRWKPEWLSRWNTWFVAVIFNPLIQQNKSLTIFEWIHPPLGFHSLALIFLPFFMITSNAEGNTLPRIKNWEYDVCKCTNYFNQATARKDCELLEGGTWSGSGTLSDPLKCINKATPLPWPDQSMIEPLVSKREGKPATFTNWQTDSTSAICTGCNGGSPVYTYGIESTNYAMVEVGDEDDIDYIADRKRGVSCPRGYGYVSATGRCMLSGVNPLKNMSGCNTVGNPVHVMSGAKRQVDQDYSRGSVSLIELTRYYSSNMKTAYAESVPASLIIFGDSWRHTYARAVGVTKRGEDVSITVFRQDGNAYFFEPEGEEWVSDADVQGTLDEIRDENGIATGWRYKDLSRGETEEFDIEGKLTSIISNSGRVVDLLYHENDGLLWRVEDDTGSFLEFTYSPDRRVASMADHAGRTWRYLPNAVGNLEYVYYPDGTADEEDNPVRRYHYNEVEHVPNENLPYHLTGITDENGIRYASFSYFTSGLARFSYHANNANRVSITYNSNGSKLITNSKGVNTTYVGVTQIGVSKVTGIQGPGCSTCDNGNTSYEYDPTTNNLSAKVEQGLRTEYGDYDTKGQYGYKIEAVGTPEERRTD